MKYDQKGEFHEGLAWARKGNKYGFIDENEKLVIPFQFFDADDFSQGLAPVMVKLWQGDYKYGFIDKKGVMVIAPKYEKAFKFSNGLANCTQYVWLVFYDFYIDKTGRKIYEYIPKDDKTGRKIYENIPKDIENEIHQLPVIKTEEDAIEAVRSGGEAALYYVPDELKTGKVCMEAVKSRGENFRFVPEKTRTAELCLEAVKNSSEYMFFEELPGEFQNKDTLLEAMKHGYPIIRAEDFTNVPTTRQMYYEAIKFDVLNMEGIGEAFRLKRKYKNPLDILSYEIFFEGIKQFGVTISILPYEYFTPEICLEAVKPDTVRHKIYNDRMNKGSAIRWIPEEFITEEICLLAVRQNGYNLQYVPPKFKTKELCRLALYNELCGFEFIPEEFLTEEWCYIGAKAKNHYIRSNTLKEIPEKFRTERVCIEAVKRARYEFSFVPEALKTKELCLTAIKGIFMPYKDIVDKIPADYWKDKDFCVQAVKQNPYVIKHVPDKIRTNEFCLDAVKYDGRCLANMPKKQKTEEVCFYAVKNTWGANQYVPEAMRKKVFGLAYNYNEYPV